MTKTSLSVAALLVLAGNASAQGLFSFDEAEGGAFISGFVGSLAPSDARVSGAGSRLEVAYDTSANFGGAVGYRLPFKYWTYFQPRLELEVSYSESDVSSARLNALPRTASGELSITSFLINNYSDITWSDGQTIVPFLGGGLGYSRLDLTLADSATGGGVQSTINDDTNAFTTTFAGGLTLQASERFELYGEARYTTIYNASFVRFADGSSAGQTLKDDVSATSFTAGVRYGF